jgi:type VI secretion system protein ImpA
MPLRDDLLTPIQGDNPAGASLRYEPVYDRIKEARRDDPLHDPPVRADWREVAELASEALAKKTKDLQLAAWLTEAQLQREGFAGLRQGLELIHGLLTNFWDHVYPEIDDGDAEMRAAPLAFVGAYLDTPVRLVPLNAEGHSLMGYRASQTVPAEDEAAADEAKLEARTAALADGKLDPESWDAGFGKTSKAWYKDLIRELDASVAQIAALEKLGDARFGDAAPSYRKLREALHEVRVSAHGLLTRKLELDPDPPDEEPIPEQPAAGGAVADGTIAAEPRSRDDAARRIAAAAKYLRKDAPTDPAPFLLLRGFRWGELRAGGRDVDPRLLAAPPTDIRTRLKGLLLDARWPELIEAAEDVMATPFGRGWLDLQRYVVTACQASGAQYDAVTSTIKGALRTLLRDLPGLLDATLMDDSPTANAETRGWLRDQGVLTGDEQEARAETEEAAISGSLERVVERMGTTQPERAIELLMRAAAQEKSERARFMRRSEAAKIMVNAGLEGVALPILQEMLEQVDAHNLEEWEAGDTIAQPLGLLYRCMMQLDNDPSIRQSLYLRVCRLDPLQAMKFASPTTTTDGESGS